MERVIDFLKYRWIAIGFSLVVLTLFSVTTYMKGGFTWGIDFIGGVKLTVQFEGPSDPGDVRKELEKHGIKADVQQYGRGELHEFIVSSKLPLAAHIVMDLRASSRFRAFSGWNPPSG